MRVRPRVRMAALLMGLAAAVATVGCAGYGSVPARATPQTSQSSGPARIPWLEPVPGASQNDDARSPTAKSSGRITQAQFKAPPTPQPQPELPKTTPQPQPQPLPPPREVPSTEAPPATHLSLDQVVNAVLVSDPKLRAGFEAISQANADALTASLRPNPTLYVDGELLPLTRPFTVTDQGGPPQFDAQVTYPIDWFIFGKRAAAMAAAAHGIKVSAADFEDQVRLRVVDAAMAYYDVLEAKTLLVLAQQDVANLERVEALVTKAVAAGGKTQVELNRLRLDLAQARRAARDIETAYISAKARLRAMIGRADSDPAFDVQGELDSPLNAVLPPPDDAFEMAVQNRPDLEADRWRTVQARANVLSENRKAYPQVAPMFGYTRQFQMKAIGFPDASSWWAAATVTLPMFDRNQGNRAKAVSLLAQSQYQYQAALVALRAEIETASREYLAARVTATEVAGEQLRLAREVRDSIIAAYQAGGRPLVDLLDAERNFRETSRIYVSSRATYWRAVYRYRGVIGQITTR